MKEYTVSGTPEFSKDIQITETTDPAHADNINAAPKQLLENTLANRSLISSIQAAMMQVTYEEDTETLVFTFGEVSGGEGTGTTDYSLPAATSSKLGGIKIGDGLKVDEDGTASVDWSKLADDPETAASVVAAGTEDLTDDEIEEAYKEATL